MLAASPGQRLPDDPGPESVPRVKVGHCVRVALTTVEAIE